MGFMAFVSFNLQIGLLERGHFHWRRGRQDCAKREETVKNHGDRQGPTEGLDFCSAQSTGDCGGKRVGCKMMRLESWDSVMYYIMLIKMVEVVSIFNIFSAMLSIVDVLFHLILITVLLNLSCNNIHLICDKTEN